MLLDKIVIPTLTFFNDDLSINIQANLKYIELLNQSKIKSIILLGTTSEGVLISLEDKKTIIQLYVNNLNSDINIYLAPSVWSVKDFKYLMNLSNRINDILFLPNSYFNRNEDELINYMYKIFDNSEKNIFLYHLPKNTNVSFSIDFIIKMKEKGLKIKGIKLSHSTLDDIITYTSIGNFSILFGSDKDIISTLNKNSDFVVCQNISSSLHQLNDQNIQSIANKNREYVKLSEYPKLKTLKLIINNYNSLFSSKVI